MAFGNKPQSMDQLLKDFLKKIPHRTKFKRGMVLHVWPEVVGEQISEITKNIHFEGDRLIIEVDNAAWRHEIHSNRYSIIKKLNDKVDAKIVKEIIVRAT